MLLPGSKPNVFSWLKVWLQHLASWIVVCNMRESVPRNAPQPNETHEDSSVRQIGAPKKITNSGTHEVTSGVAISRLLPKVTCWTNEVGVDHAQLVPEYTVIRFVGTHRPWPESCADLVCFLRP